MNQSKAPPPWLVTLTYPEKFESARGSKKHLDRFAVAFARKYPAASFIWKLEPQKRGAPHFHLLVFGCTPAVEWVAATWHAIAAPSEPLHLAWHLGQLGNGNRPCVEQASSWDRVNAYLSKYMTKLAAGDEWHEPGRFWGIIARDNLNALIDLETSEISERAAVIAQRVISRRSHASRRSRFLVHYVGPIEPGEIPVRPIDLNRLRDRLDQLDDRGEPLVRNGSVESLLRWLTLTDLGPLENRKFARRRLEKQFGGSLRMVWAGKRDQIRGGRPCSTVYVPEAVGRKLLAYAVSAAAAPCAPSRPRVNRTAYTPAAPARFCPPARDVAADLLRDLNRAIDARNADRLDIIDRVASTAWPQWNPEQTPDDGVPF